LRYPLSTLLFTTLVTAVALATGKLLTGYRDAQQVIAIVVLWAVTGFAIGTSLPSSQGKRQASALCACAAVWLFYFFSDFALDNLLEPQVDTTFPAILVVVLRLHDAYILLLSAIVLTALILFAAQTDREGLLVASIGTALLMWFLVAWVGFVAISVALLNVWSN
jgi:hypothetical protein